MTRKTYTVQEWCDRSGMGKSKTYELIREGKILSIRLGRWIRIPKAWADNFLEGQGNGDAAA